jgi:hypothetical protein
MHRAATSSNEPISASCSRYLPVQPSSPPGSDLGRRLCVIRRLVFRGRCPDPKLLLCFIDDQLILRFPMDDLSILLLQHQPVGSCVGGGKSPPEIPPPWARPVEADAIKLKGIKISECTALRVQSGSDFGGVQKPPIGRVGGSLIPAHRLSDRAQRRSSPASMA